LENEITDLPLAGEKLLETIGYHFSDDSLLTEALTHSSYVNEHRECPHLSCNERLEFLGDSVLSIVVSRYLFFRYPERQEGDLSKIRSSVVCEKALAKYASKIELGMYLSMGKGEEKNEGRTRPSVISDAFEALLGAMYIDSGYNADRVSEFVLPFVKEEIEYIIESDTFIDYKTALQQIVQQAEGEKLEYVMVSEEGPDHMKTFVYKAMLNSNEIGRGSGSSKRQAEQNAAKEALKLFGTDIKI